MKRPRIFLVDDHQILRDGLRLLLANEFEVVGDAFDAEAGWQGVQDTRPDLVILDLELPGASGTSLLLRIRDQLPLVKVVILTGHEEADFLQHAVRGGAHGYVLKSALSREILTAVRSALAGQVYLCPEIATLVVREFRRQATPDKNPLARLTGREIDVLREIAAGRTTKEIAFSLGVSAKTVETQRASILAKLRVGSVAELTKFAIREGLTTL